MSSAVNSVQLRVYASGGYDVYVLTIASLADYRTLCESPAGTVVWCPVAKRFAFYVGG